MAHVKSTQDWDRAGSEAGFIRAISLDMATRRRITGMRRIAWRPGRLPEALEQILVAQALDPISSIIARDVAAIHYHRRDFRRRWNNATTRLN